MLKVVLVSLLRLLLGGKSGYPEILVLEYGADKPGDIKNLLEIVKPQIAVVTAVGDIPVHVEFYSGPEAVAREKAKLIQDLPANGFAILNGDDEAVREMQDGTRAHVITFGITQEAEVRVTNFENRMQNGKPAGVSFKISYGGSFVPVHLNDCFGKTSALAAAAAASLGIVFGMHLVKITEALLDYEAPNQRLKLIPGIKGTYIIDDSYNASPLSMAAAIDTVKSLKASRKVAVLGDMLELGKYSIEAHESIGKLAAPVFYLLITVGPRAKFIAESAQRNGLNRKNIFSFADVDETRIPVQDLIRKGDLILIKGSHAMHLERLVKEIRQI